MFALKRFIKRVFMLFFGWSLLSINNLFLLNGKVALLLTKIAKSHISQKDKIAWLDRTELAKSPTLL